MFDSIAKRIDHAFTGEKKDVFSHRVFVYTILFAVMAFVFCFPVYIEGHTFIWRTDGFEQQYMFFILEGEWLRQLLNNIFVQHQFIIPMWNDTIGYGADYINSMMNTLGNPINLLSVFATTHNAEFLLQLTVPITLYLGGLTFLWYCQYHHFSCYGSVIGAVVYVFSGFSIIALWQIFMIYPLVLAPLMMLGADKVFKENKPVILIVASGLTFLCSAYTAYIMCIVLFFYCLLKWWVSCKHTFRTFIVLVAKIIGCLLVGALIGAVLLFPNVMGLLSQSRISLQRTTPMLYPLKYYLSLFLYCSSLVSPGSQCFLGFSPVVFVAFIYLFLTKKQKKAGQQKDDTYLFLALVILMTAMVCLPICGRMFNGFAYATNRWLWAYSFATSAVVALGISNSITASLETRKKIAHILFVYCIICLIVLIVFRQQVSIGYTFVLAAALSLFMFSSSSHARVGMMVVVIACCGILSYNFVKSVGSNQISVGEGVDRAYYHNPASLAQKTVQDSSYGRIDTGSLNADQLIRNEGIALDLRMTNFYNSYYTEDIDRFHTDLGLNTSTQNFAYNSLAGRTPLEVITGSNIMLVPTDHLDTVPALYDKVIAQQDVYGRNYSVLESSHVPNLAFVYHSVMSQDQFESLDLVDRQEALLHSVVLSDNDASQDMQSQTSDAQAQTSDAQSQNANAQSNDGTTSKQSSENDMSQDSDEFPNTTLAGNIHVSDLDTTSNGIATTDTPRDISVDGDHIIVRKTGAKLTLHVNIPAQQEALVEVSGLDFQGMNRLQVMSDEQRAGLKKSEKINLGMESLLSSSEDVGTIKFSSGKFDSSVEQRNGNNDLYGGKDNWLFDLGTSDVDRDTITIEFATVGSYTFNNMNIKAESTSQILSNADALCAMSAQNIQFANNTYTCTADGADNGGYLFFSVPYSQGWSATVDGQPAQIQKADDGFMSVQITPGTHNVQLVYDKPYLKQSFILSCIGIVLLIAVGIWQHLKTKQMNLNK